MIVAAIQNVIAQMSVECTFIYGLKGWQNLKADKTAKFPVIFLDEPITSNDTFGQGGAVDIQYNLNIAFLTKSKLDWTPEEHDVCIQQMRSLRREFILRLKKVKDTTTNEHLFRSIDNIVTTNAVNVFDVNMTGVLVSMQVTPMAGDGICLTGEEKIIAKPEIKINEITQNCDMNGFLQVVISFAWHNAAGYDNVNLQAFVNGVWQTVDNKQIAGIIGTDQFNETLKPNEGQGQTIDIRLEMTGTGVNIYSGIVTQTFDQCPAP